MSDCMFCGSFVGEESGDGGCKGRTVGSRDICEQCLAELKYWMESIKAKSPSLRETNLDDDESSETEASTSSESEVSESDDSNGPFSSTAKI